MLVIVWSVYKEDFNKATTHVFNYVFLRKWNFGVDYIIENHLAHEEYKQQVYKNMWLSSMIRFNVCDMKGVTEEKNDVSHRSVEICWLFFKKEHSWRQKQRSHEKLINDKKILFMHYAQYERNSAREYDRRLQFKWKIEPFLV